MNLEEEIKQLIIDCLKLEDITAADINSEEPLFGEGLALDSIDALEFGMALKKKYNITLGNNKEENRQYFYSVKTIADFVKARQNG